MGAGHSQPLYRVDDSPVHRVPAEVKIVCLVLTVLAVVATPRDMFWPYAIYAVLIVAVWLLAHIPLGWVLPRMLIEAPFVMLAVLLPFAEGGRQLSIAGIQLSVTGLWAAWGIVVKGTLGVAASLTFAATTSARELPVALSRLGMPALVTSVLVLMIRYLDVLTSEAQRMRMARLSRGDSPRMLHQAGAVARSVGALFLRSYERGERVYLAMLSRGFDGRVPELAAGPDRARAVDWVALLPAMLAIAVSISAWALR